MARMFGALGCAMLAGAAQAQDFRVLVFTKTAGFRHDSIPAAIAAVRSLGKAHCFEVEATEDAGAFGAGNLARFRVVVFLLTTGDVLDPAQESAFMAWHRAGGGWVGVHSAADTEYGWAYYQQLVAAHFLSHPEQQTATIHVEDPLAPSTAHLPDPWVRFDEWYSYHQNPRPGVHVLLTLDESTYSGGQMGADHPIAWRHEVDGGRAWYTGLGHTTESYIEPSFTRHLLGGLLWAAGAGDCACDADCNSDAVLTLADFGCFQTRFALGDPRADCNGDGVRDLADFGCFQTRFALGCP